MSEYWHDAELAGRLLPSSCAKAASCGFSPAYARPNRLFWATNAVAGFSRIATVIAMCDTHLLRSDIREPAAFLKNPRYQELAYESWPNFFMVYILRYDKTRSRAHLLTSNALSKNRAASMAGSRQQLLWLANGQRCINAIFHECESRLHTI
jgi:hypothetical protein